MIGGYGKTLLYGAMWLLPWTAVLTWEKYDHYRSERREVSTGVYLGMIGAVQEYPNLAGPMRAALSDGAMSNKEALPIMDATSVFTIPNAEHWHPPAQAAARRKLAKLIRVADQDGRTNG